VKPCSPAASADSHKETIQVMNADVSSAGAVVPSSLWQFANAEADQICENAEDAPALVTSLKRKKNGKKSAKCGKSSSITACHSIEHSAANDVEHSGSGFSSAHATFGTGTEITESSDSAALSAAFLYKNEQILPVEAISRLQDGIQSSFISSLRLVSNRVDDIWQRLSSLNAKVEKVQQGHWIRDISKHAAEAERSRDQSKAASNELLSISVQLEEKRALLQSLGGELARRELAQQEAIEIEATVSQHRQQLSDLIRKQECLQLSFVSLNSQYERMDAEVASRRDELRMQISALAEEKCSLEVALSLHHERLEAQVPLDFVANLS
jgi:hypothetical protein